MLSWLPLAPLIKEDSANSSSHTTHEQIADDIEKKSNMYSSVYTYPEYQASLLVWNIGSPIVLALGTVGSVLSILVLRQPALRNVTTTFYLAVLAVADLGVLYTGLLPLWLDSAFHLNLHISSDTGCRLLTFLVYFCLGFSAWILVAVTVDRCVFICAPLTAKSLCTTKKARIVVGAIAVIFVIINVHYFFTVSVIFVKTATIAGVNEYICHFNRAAQGAFLLEKVMSWIDLLILCLLPFLVMLVANLFIVRYVTLSARRLQAHDDPHLSTSQAESRIQRFSYVFRRHSSLFSMFSSHSKDSNIPRAESDVGNAPKVSVAADQPPVSEVIVKGMTANTNTSKKNRNDVDGEPTRRHAYQEKFISVLHKRDQGMTPVSVNEQVVRNPLTVGAKAEPKRITALIRQSANPPLADITATFKTCPALQGILKSVPEQSDYLCHSPFVNNDVDRTGATKPSVESSCHLGSRPEHDPRQKPDHERSYTPCWISPASKRIPQGNVSSAPKAAQQTSLREIKAEPNRNTTVTSTNASAFLNDGNTHCPQPAHFLPPLSNASSVAEPTVWSKGDRSTSPFSFLLMKTTRPSSPTLPRSSKSSFLSSISSIRNRSLVRRRGIPGLTLMLLVVNTVFMLLTAPLAVFIIGFYYWKPPATPHEMAQNYLAWALVSLLQYTNNSVHFFLFFLTGPRFRAELLAMLKRPTGLCRCCPSGLREQRN